MLSNRNRSFSRALQRGTAMTLVSMMALSGVAVAQDAIVSSGQAGAPVAATADDDIQEVIVVGARAAQQSANERKKRAKTATDSIVADDVGAFPDRNINEAISRIAGVALQRNGFGEGDGINIRGNGADLTRVELDGLGVQNAGGFGMGADGARSADMRELPSDLIASVDVVKGTTADMTEGSLGGGVQIKTRTALDFKKPYFSMRIGAQENSLGKKLTPDFNVVASRKFLDGRLGVLASVTSNHVQNNNHSMAVSNGSAGYIGLIDFDNSPEKTFAFNPGTVSTDAANVLFGNGSTHTPLSLVTRAASAQTKADCAALFPLSTSTATNTTANNNRNQLVWERQTCLNQWNDYQPSLVRSFLNSQEEKRLAADIRFDFRVNDRLNIFAKYAIANRLVDDQFRNRNLGGININTGQALTQVANGVWDYTNTNPRIRTAVPGRGYYIYDQTYGINTYNNVHILGNAVNVEPGSVVVDANHHLTSYTITDGTANIDQIDNTIDNKSTYITLGGNYKHDRLKVDLLLGKSSSEFSREDRRTSRAAPYGRATMTVQPNGLWAYELPDSYDESDPSQYVVMLPQAPQTASGPTATDPGIYPAYSSLQRPLVSTSFGVSFEPRLSETEELTAKLDATYDLADKVPFFTLFKSGVSFRNPTGKSWDRPGGRVIKSAVGAPLLSNGQPNPAYVAPIILPSTNLRGSFRACQPTATSTESCNYGYVPFTNYSNVLTGVTTVTPAQMVELIRGSMVAPDSVFFDGFPDRGDLMASWQGIDVEGLFSQLGAAQNFNFDCMKRCKANDGKYYDQPYFAYDEKITAAYYMVEFEQALPFNMEFGGNVGLRMVETDVSATGPMTINNIRITSAFVPSNPNATAGITTTTYADNVSIAKKTRDWLPSYNFNLWLVPDQVVLRYYTAKTVSRPSVGRLLPGGNCDIDERRENLGLGLPTEGLEYGCGGRVGNPELKPYTAKNHNTSIEWYPNKDTMVSLAYHKLDVRIGAPVGVSVTGKPFAGTTAIDPVTGQSIGDLEFTYPTWGNGPGYERTGWEFTSKTAFTFLPWRLRYTGADFNYSMLESANNVTVVDPNTGDGMPPVGEADFMNLSVWYDDGTTNARISYQAREEFFLVIGPGAGNQRNNYPGQFGPFSPRPVPYNPGSPQYQDETKYIDAKISHKLRPNLEVFLEGRNITQESSTVSGGGYLPFENGEKNLYQINYGGRRVMAGIVYRMQ